MKRRSLVICLFIIGYITICSYKNGPGTNGWDCTGAESGLGNVAGCRTCHGTTATSAITCLIELDSSGVSTTQYVGGGIYTVTITGTNNSTFSLPKYGFQMACLRGSTAITTPIPAGIWSGLPVSTHIANPSAGNFVLTNVEQTSVLAATLGTGATGTIYTKTFNWTAPAAGTGTVSFWGVVNAVNGDGSASSADKWNLNHIIITELIPTGISEATQNVGLSAFPNPVNDNLHINMDLIQTGNYILSIFNLTGDKILDRKIEVGLSSAENINTADWNPGVYEIVLENETVRKVIKVIKQ